MKRRDNNERKNWGKKGSSDWEEGKTKEGRGRKNKGNEVRGRRIGEEIEESERKRKGG